MKNKKLLANILRGFAIVLLFAAVFNAGQGTFAVGIPLLVVGVVCLIMVQIALKKNQ